METLFTDLSFIELGSLLYLCRLRQCIDIRSARVCVSHIFSTILLSISGSDVVWGGPRGSIDQ